MELKLKTVFWDLDGTLADTEMYGHRIAFNLAFADFGLDWIWEKEEYSKLLTIAGGKNRIKYYMNSVSNIFDEELLKKVHQRKQQHYMNLMKSGNIKLRKGVLRLIHELSDNCIQQWIVTTSGKEAILGFLSNFSSLVRDKSINFG